MPITYMDPHHAYHAYNASSINQAPEVEKPKLEGFLEFLSEQVQRLSEVNNIVDRTLDRWTHVPTSTIAIGDAVNPAPPQPSIESRLRIIGAELQRQIEMAGKNSNRLGEIM